MNINSAPINLPNTLKIARIILPKVSITSCIPVLALLSTFFLNSELFTFAVTSFTPSFTREETS